MKKLFLLSMCSLFALLATAQSNRTNRTFGLAINSSTNGELAPVRLVPTATLTIGNNQLEAGLGINPLTRNQHRIHSAELNYKYYPSGMVNTVNPYFLARVAYVHDARDQYYPATFNYLFAHAGYGFEINLQKGLYLGTNISLGTYTNSKNVQNAYPHLYTKEKLFDSFGLTLAGQVTCGYRF